MNIVFEMKSLILILFLGAVVSTLAENPFDDKAVKEYLAEEKGDTFAELADKRNGRQRTPTPSRRPRELVRSPPLSRFLNRLLGCGE